MIIGLSITVAYILGVFSRLLYERWRVARKTSPQAIQNRDSLIKTFENGELWTSSYSRVPKFTVKEGDNGYWEVTVYEEDIDEFLWPDKTYLLKLKDIQILLAGNRVRMQYGDELTWKPTHKLRWVENPDEPKVIFEE